MLSVAAVALVVMGAVVAALAQRCPARQAALEHWAGGLLLSGLALVGAALAMHARRH